MTLLNTIYGFIINELALKLIVLSSMTLIITLAHSISFRYLINKQFIFTSLMLSPLVLAVTTVIATNLYLSLGMIGALSIVRYRTPVKSHYELALFFSFICLGIISGVNFFLSIKVFILLLIIPFLYEFILKKIFATIQTPKNSSQSNSIILEILISNYSSFEFIKKYNIKKNLIKIETNNETKETSIIIFFDEIDHALALKEIIEKSDFVNNVNLSYA
jgi:hypothetical protein|tara:strand:+ start:229 stop:885 length:657 start_codon:yes stop_codon:yes gene_type:complete